MEMALEMDLSGIEEMPRHHQKGLKEALWQKISLFMEQLNAGASEEELEKIIAINIHELLVKNIKHKNSSE